MQVVNASDGDLAEGDDDVALLEPGPGSWTPLLDGIDANGGGNRHLVRARERARHVDVLAGDADVGAANAPVANQARCDEPGRVDANRKAETLRGEDHGRVDANHLAARRHER